MYPGKTFSFVLYINLDIRVFGTRKSQQETARGKTREERMMGGQKRRFLGNAGFGKKAEPAESEFPPLAGFLC